jgi:hypothetical protein
MADLSLEFRGIDVDDMPLESTQRVLELYCKQAIRMMQEYLDAEDKNASGNLRESMEWSIIKTSEQLIVASIDFPEAPYWAYVEHGVGGAQSTAKAPDSPFRFGSKKVKYPKGTMRKAIRTWIGHRRFQWRDAKGRFLSYDAMAPVITRSVYLTGISPTPFASTSMKTLWKRMKTQVEFAFADDLDRWMDESDFAEEITITISV